MGNVYWTGQIQDNQNLRNTEHWQAKKKKDVNSRFGPVLLYTNSEILCISTHLSITWFRSSLQNIIYKKSRSKTRANWEKDHCDLHDRQSSHHWQLTLRQSNERKNYPKGDMNDQSEEIWYETISNLNNNQRNTN